MAKAGQVSKKNMPILKRMLIHGSKSSFPPKEIILKRGANFLENKSFHASDFDFSEGKLKKKFRETLLLPGKTYQDCPQEGIRIVIVNKNILPDTIEIKKDEGVYNPNAVEVKLKRRGELKLPVDGKDIQLIEIGENEILKKCLSPPSKKYTKRFQKHKAQEWSSVEKEFFEKRLQGLIAKKLSRASKRFTK